MEVVKQAAELAASGASVIHLSIGEPDFTAPEPVRRAAISAIERGATQYTAALGLSPLRERIARWYATRFACEVDPARVVVTAGASGALLLTCTALLEPGAELLLPDPSYPCNRHFATALGGYAWERAGLIWYRALTGALPSTADFSTFANATLAAAAAEYGEESEEVAAVRAAWTSVGVIDDARAAETAA